MKLYRPDRYNHPRPWRVRLRLTPMQGVVLGLVVGHLSGILLTAAAHWRAGQILGG